MVVVVLLLLSLCLKRSVNKCVYLLRALTVEQKDDSGTVGETVEARVLPSPMN